MEFPDTEVTRLTEKIMRKVQENTDKHSHTRLDSTTYNRVYEAVYDTLEDAPRGDLCWLIKYVTGPAHQFPLYFCGFSVPDSRGDRPIAEKNPNKAIRFCRLEDAQKTIVCSASLLAGGWFASEHSFASEE